MLLYHGLYQQTAKYPMDHPGDFLYNMHMQGDPVHFLWADFLPHYASALTRTFPDYCGLQYLDGGRMTLQVDDQSYVVHGTYAWCVYPGPQFVYAPALPEGYWSHRYVTFQGPRTDVYGAEGLLPFTPQSVSPTLRLGERLDHLRTLVRRLDRQGQWLATHLLEGILLDLAEARTTVRIFPAWLPAVLETLDRHLTSPLDYTRMAAAHGVTEATLRRQFKAHLGVPLHTYVLQKKLALASDLLRTSTLPIKTIAQQLGYTDVYFFHRQFRQYQGMPPRQYRMGL
jgi:AraC-like DNA-binding protein